MKKVLAFVLFIVILQIASLSLASVQKKVVILPFAPKAPQGENIEYIKQGIFQILTSSISTEANISVFAPSEIAAVAPNNWEEGLSPELAKNLGVKIGADYVVYGDIIKIGEAFNISTRLLDVKSGKIALSPEAIAKNINDLIPTVAEIGQKVGAKISGRSLPAIPQGKGKSEQALIAPIGVEVVRGVEVSSLDSSTPNAEIISKKRLESLGSGAGVWMSGDYQTEFVALDVGDVNGDGKNEIVVAGRNAIRIFRKDGDVFSMINKIDLSRREYILALDIWDTDGDGVSEVIVSSLGSRHSATDVGGTHSNNVVSSFVIAYQDGVFKKRVEKLPWLLRVIDTDEGQKLVGQTLGLNYPFDNPIHEIVYQNGKYQQGKDLGISRGLSVYSLVLAKLDTQLPERVVSTNDDDYLCMYEKTTAHVSQLSIFGGSVNFVYKSNEYFGGSNSYIQYYGAPRLGETVDVRRVYINPRIIVTKALGEGKPRLILARNISPSGRVLQTMKTFTSSEMVAMEWDGLGIAELWRTRGIGGYVADFSFKDADNDGEKDLVLAIIKSAGSGMGEVSVIAIYKFARL